MGWDTSDRPSNIVRLEEKTLQTKLGKAEIALQSAQERIAYLEHTRNQALDEVGRLQTKLVHLQAKIRDLELRLELRDAFIRADDDPEADR